MIETMAGSILGVMLLILFIIILAIGIVSTLIFGIKLIKYLIVGDK